MPLTGHDFDFSINQNHPINNDQNTQQLYRSSHELKPNHQLIRVTKSSVKYGKNTNTDTIALPIYKISPYMITPPVGLLEY